MKFGVAVAGLVLLPYAQGALQLCPDLSQPGPDIFDFIIVGSGAGGGPLAARLAEEGFSGGERLKHCPISFNLSLAIVFLVDAGNDVNIFNTTLPAYWGRATEGNTSPL
jgi:choline dehydrogenase